jgi:hypothetical protein
MSFGICGSFIQQWTPIATTGTLFSFEINQRGIVYSDVTATLNEDSTVTYSEGPDPAECDFALARFFAAVKGGTVYPGLYANWANPNWRVNSLSY